MARLYAESASTLGDLQKDHEGVRIDKSLGNFLMEEFDEKPGGDPDAEKAKSRAVTNPDGFDAIFSKLKSKQTLWLAYSAVMGTASKAYKPYTVGRRSRSKKYNVVAVTISERGQKPGRYMKMRLMKRGDGAVGLALGDMAASIIGMYLE